MWLKYQVTNIKITTEEKNDLISLIADDIYNKIDTSYDLHQSIEGEFTKGDLYITWECDISVDIENNYVDGQHVGDIDVSIPKLDVNFYFKNELVDVQIHNLKDSEVIKFNSEIETEVDSYIRMRIN